MHVTPSYDFDQFSDRDRKAELTRLQRQATLLIDRELAMLRAVGLAPASNALEIGCGPGFLTGAIADVVAPGNATGLDTSAELLEAARAMVQPRHPNLRFIEGNAYSTGLADGTFDFVYSRLVYQHLDKPAAALREARRIVRPGGKVCVMDVDDGWLTLEPPCEAFETFTRLAREAQITNGGDRLIGRKLPGLMKQAGFARVDLQVISASSLDLGLATFLDITTRFKAIQIKTAEATVLLDEIQRFAVAHGDTALGVVGVFVAVGTV